MNSELLKGRLKAFEKKQIVLSLLGLLILLGLSIVFNYLRLSGQAIQTAKFISRLTQIENFREVGITLQEARLDHFTTIKYVSSDPQKSFTLPEISELLPDHSFWKSVSHDQIVIPIKTVYSNDDKIIFEFSRFNDLGWALFIWLVLNLVSIPQTRFMKRRIVEGFNESLRIETELATAEVARKVRHNIRTPLTALIRLSAREVRSDSDYDLLKDVINQIKNLISELDNTKKNAEQGAHFYSLLSVAMKEVRIVAPSNIDLITEVDDSLASASGEFQEYELRSIISNLATNAFEASKPNGTVKISAKDYGDRVLIDIVDNGKGIPKEIISKVTEKGFSYEKSNGTGLGLYHAKVNIESWGGSLVVKSEKGHGTTVTLSIPITFRSPWYVPRIKLLPQDVVLILDDQVSVHSLWQERLFEAGFSSEIHFCSTIPQADDFLKKSDSHHLVIFADYDLGTNRNGLDFLDRVPLQSKKYLVTGHFDDLKIQERCENQKVFLIPKTTLTDVPIVVLR
jgi:signal transduction histidine kinase